MSYFDDFARCLRRLECKHDRKGEVAMSRLFHAVVLDKLCCFIVLFRNCDAADFLEGILSLVENEVNIGLCLRLPEYVPLRVSLELRYNVKDFVIKFVHTWTPLNS